MARNIDQPSYVCYLNLIKGKGGIRRVSGIALARPTQMVQICPFWGEKAEVSIAIWVVTGSLGKSLGFGGNAVGPNEPELRSFFQLLFVYHRLRRVVLQLSAWVSGLHTERRELR